MGTVHLVADPTRRSPTDGDAVEIGAPEEYFAGRRLIYACIENTHAADVRVVVRHPVVCTWFDDLRESPCVRYEEFSPLKDLVGAVGLPAPAGLHDTDVVQLDLGRLALESPPAGDDLTTWIVRHRLGLAWLEDRPPSDRLAEIVTSVMTAPLDNLWLQNQAYARLREWQRRAGVGQQKIWEYLSAAPNALVERALALVAYAHVFRYPRRKIAEWLGKLWHGLDTLETLAEAAVMLGKVPLPYELRKGLEEHVRVYLAERIGTAELSQILTYTTGRIAGEGRIVALKLLEHPWELTPAAFEQVSAIAAPEDAALIERLRKLLPVAAPGSLPDTWMADEVDDVLSWVETSYLPWYQAVRYRGETVDVAAICASFAGWLERSYPDLIARLDRVTLGSRDRILALVSSGRSVIWVIVDALGMEWAEVLADACTKRGMVVTGRSLQLTVLPTITVMAKPALLSGVTPAQRPDAGLNTSLAEYRKIAQEGDWGEGGAVVAAEWDHDDLAGLVSAHPASVWIYLVNQVDSAIVNARMPIKDRATRIGLVCDQIVETVRTAQDIAEVKYGYRPTVVFSADHGFSTPTPGAAPLKTDGFKSHGRCIELGDSDVAPDPGWLTLEPPSRYGLVRRYAIAYGNHYPELSVLTATHGGANPEEVCVAHVECDGVPVRVMAPWVRVLSSINAGQARQHAELAVRNANAVTLTDIVIAVPGLFGAPVEIGRLRAREEVVARCELVGGLHAPGGVSVAGTMRYAAGDGTVHEDTFTLALTVESPLQATTDEQSAFEEMFDE